MRTKILSILLLFVTCSLYAQISTNEKPIGLILNARSIQSNDKTIKLIKQPNIDYLKKEDKKDKENGIPPRFGYRTQVDFDISNSGEWITLGNGDKLWRLNISSPGALSLNLLYDKFWLPKGGKLFIYSVDGKHSIGAFTSRNNNGTQYDVKGFATGLIYSDDIIVEYWQPANVKAKPIISIEYVVYGYRYINVHYNKGLGDSGDCQVNINCSEGDDWQKEKEAVALILVNGTRWCTGSLINTTAQDLRPLFLTANHCLTGHDAIENPNLYYYSFYWHYESPRCSNTNSESPHYSTSGAIIRANNEESDFALLELTEDPRELNNFKPYYLGWDNTGNSFAGAVGIHHPSGDVKKIATLKKKSNNNFNGNINFWSHYWDATENGYSVTEGGSSGSPLINNTHHIVGQLWGGGSINCSNPSLDIAAYGKFSVSWTGNNSGDKRRRLKDWLDPENTGIRVLDGQELLPPNIKGADLICDQSSYTIENLPNGATVTWKASNNKAKLISGQGTSTAIFKKHDNGKTKIKANINYGNSNIELTTSDIWVGVPSRDTLIFQGKSLRLDRPVKVKQYSIRDYFIKNIVTDPFLVKYRWKVDYNSWYDFNTGKADAIVENEIGFYNMIRYDNVGLVHLYISQKNQCGEAEPFLYKIKVEKENNGISDGDLDTIKPFSINPNPVQDNIIIDMQNLPIDKDNLLRNTCCQIEIWNTQRLIKQLQTTDIKTNINISSLPKGLYYIILRKNGKIYKQTFVKE